MVEIKEVTTRRDKKEFVEFPLRLYKDCPYFCPPLYGDELTLMGPKNIYNDTCEAVRYLALRDGKVVGRISGIIQKDSNRIRGEKRVRFDRFDSIDDQEVADALFKAVESWAVARGMDTAHGPLSFSDLEREGLLIDGFDQMSTFEEQYNYPYYQKLIEACGYTKEVDWTESKLTVPADYDGELERLGDFVMKRYKLHLGTAGNVNEFLAKYGVGFFELLDKSYKNIYGTVPFTKAMKDQTIAGFMFIIDLRYVAVVLDEHERMVCFGICFPNITKVVRTAGGRITPLMLLRFLKAKRSPRVLDLGLVGVDPEFANMGISAILTGAVMKMLREGKIDYAETNLNLEDNYDIQNMWRRFGREIHKRRRAFVKKLV